MIYPLKNHPPPPQNNSYTFKKIIAIPWLPEKQYTIYICAQISTSSTPPPPEKRALSKFQTATIWKNYKYLCSKKCDNN